MDLLPYADMWEVEDLFGPPDRIEFTEDAAHYWIGYCYDGVTIRFASYSYGYLLQSVEVSDPSFAGPRGIRVGDTLEDVINSFRVKPYTLTDEQTKKIVQKDLPNTMLYATVYDVKLWNIPEFTQITAPMGYIEGVLNQPKALRLTYVDPLTAYSLLSEYEQMLASESLAYLIFNIVDDRVESYRWIIEDMVY